MVGTGPQDILKRSELKEAVRELFADDSEVALFYFAARDIHVRSIILGGPRELLGIRGRNPAARCVKRRGFPLGPACAPAPDRLALRLSGRVPISSRHWRKLNLARTPGKDQQEIDPSTQ
jgi:hypothetical protein